MTASTPKQIACHFLLLAALTLSACSPTKPTGTPTPSSTSFPPSPTPIPMAATVNGEGITLEEFKAELARFQSAQEALGNSVAPEEASQRVLSDLVDQVLLEQGAQTEGYTLDVAALQTRVDRLAEEIGGVDKLAAWEAKYGYNDESFRLAIGRQITAAWMSNKIITAVPETIEQVHIRQILLNNSDTAQTVLEQLKSGIGFEVLAAQYDPATRGELGWFPRGYLLQPKIEEAAFALQTGQISEVIQTSVGYHILKVIERDPNHPLSPDARLTLQNQALSNWLEEQRARSTIIMTP